MQNNILQENETLWDKPPETHEFKDKNMNPKLQKNIQDNNTRQLTQQSTDMDVDSPKQTQKHHIPNNYKKNEDYNYDSKIENRNFHQNNRRYFNKEKDEKTLEKRKMKQERMRIKTPNFVRLIQKQTNFPAIYVILTVIACGICVYFGSFEIFFTNFVGIIFPIYWSMRALDTDINSKDEEKQWYTYWLIFLSMLPFDMLFGRIFRYIPLFYFAKYIFLCWMFLPNFYGASYIHDSLIKKKFPQLEVVYRIDNATGKIRKEFKQFTARLQQKMLEQPNLLKEGEKINKKKFKPIKLKKINEPVNENDEFQDQQRNIEDEEAYNKAKDKKELVQRPDEYRENTENSNGKNINELKEETTNELTVGKRQEPNQSNESVDEKNIEINKDKESSENHNHSKDDKAEKSNAYEDIVTQINEIKSRSGKTKELLNTTIEKIWDRMHKETLLKKDKQENKSIDNETDKHRYEEQMRAKNTADSGEFDSTVNQAMPEKEDPQKSAIEQDKDFDNLDKEKEREGNKKNIKNEQDKNIYSNNDVEKKYEKKNESNDVKGENKSRAVVSDAKKYQDENENKENIQPKNVDTNKSNKKDSDLEKKFNKDDELKKKEIQTHSPKKEYSQMEKH